MKFIPRDPNKHLHWPRGFDDSAFKRPGYLRLSRWTRSRKVPVSCKSWHSMTEDELARSAREMEEEHDSCWYYHHLCCPEKPAKETMISETLTLKNVLAHDCKSLSQVLQENKLHMMWGRCGSCSPFDFLSYLSVKFKWVAVQTERQFVSFNVIVGSRPPLCGNFCNFSHSTKVNLQILLLVIRGCTPSPWKKWDKESVATSLDYCCRRCCWFFFLLPF